jgi:hypothetical protein
LQGGVHHSNVHLASIHGQDMDNFQFAKFFYAYDDLAT